jgi:hypothetical protein
MEQQGTEIFSVAGRFRFVKVFDVLFLAIPGPWDCNSVPLKKFSFMFKFLE